MASFRNLLGLPVKLWDSRAAGQVLQLSSDKEHWEFGDGGGISDAPSDGATYGRKNGGWIVVASSSGGHTIGPGLVLDATTNIVRVAQSGDVQITTASLSIGLAASSTATLTASGGTAPLTWTVSPALPSGLTMSTGGVITNDGTAAAGEDTRTYTVTDANNQQVSKSVALTVTEAVTNQFATLNASDMGSALSLSNGDLTVTHASGSGWSAVRATVGKKSGKWYFEVTNNANGSTDGDAIWGFESDTASLSTYPGNASLGANSMGWEPNLAAGSARFQNGSLGTVSGYPTLAVGQNAAFAIDFDSGSLWVKNSGASGWAGGGDPAAGTSPTFTFTAGTHLHPTVSAYSGPQEATANFGASAFAGTVPTGFNAGWYAPESPGTPTFVSRFSTPSSTDAQSVATDGTNIWYSDSNTIYKYTMAGVLITSRNVMTDNPAGDSPSAKAQINGLAINAGVLYVSGADFTTVGTSYVNEYDPDTLAHVARHEIAGDWFSESLAFKGGFLWVSFHANEVVAKVDTSTWTTVATFPLTFAVTGSSGGYGSGTGYDGITWIGDYLLCNIHEIYDQDYLDVYYWTGAEFEEVARLPRVSSIATQGLAADPVAANTLWFAERNYSGTDSIAKSSY